VRPEPWAGRLELQPLVVSDLPLLHEWLGAPHVERWWGERGAYETTVAHYLPSLDGRDPTRLLAIVVDSSSAREPQTAGRTTVAPNASATTAVAAPIAATRR
jgi:hypothetical protein